MGRHVGSLALTLALVACTSGNPPIDRPAAIDEIDARGLAGTIDPLERAWLRFLAAEAPGELPADLRDLPAAEEPRSVAAYAVLRTRRAELSVHQAALFDALTVSPLDPRFMNPGEGRAFAPGQGCKAAYAGLPLVPAPGEALETRYWAFVPVVASRGGPAGQEDLHRRIREALAAPTPSLPGHEPAEVSFGQYLDQVFELVLRLGLADPRTANRPRVVVNVITCDGDLNDARAYEDHIFAGVGLALEHSLARRIVLPHELIHLTQYASLAPKTVDDAWPMEAMATYLEDHFAPDVQRWRGHLTPDDRLPARIASVRFNRAFRCFEEGFHDVANGRCLQAPPHRGAERAGPGDYSRFVWFAHLEAKEPGRWPAPGVADFVQQLAAEPRPGKLISLEALADFQLALLGRVEGRPDLPLDRRDALRSLDLPADDERRYTFVIKEKSLADSILQRVLASRGDLHHAPSATWRWLIELPPELEPRKQASGLTLVWRGLGDQAVAFGSLSATDPPTLDLSAPGYQAVVTDTERTLEEHIVPAPSPGRRRWIFVGTSPWVTHPGSYELGVNLPDRCLARCNAHYPPSPCSVELCAHLCLNRTDWNLEILANPPACPEGPSLCRPGLGLAHPYHVPLAPDEVTFAACRVAVPDDPCHTRTVPAGTVVPLEWPPDVCTPIGEQPCRETRIRCGQAGGCGLQMRFGPDGDFCDWVDVGGCSHEGVCDEEIGACPPLRSLLDGRYTPEGPEVNVVPLPMVPGGLCGSGKLCNFIFLCPL